MKKYIPYIIIIALVIALLLSMQKCSSERKANNANMDALTDTVAHYKNKLGTQTASIKTLQVNNRQLQKNVIDKDAELSELAKEFAKVKSVVKYKTVTQIDTITVTYKDSIPCEFERFGSKVDKWYSFKYESTPKGFKIDSLTIPNTATVITGVKRKWFLGQETLTTDITNSNPYIKVEDIKAAEITIETPFYKKWWVWAGIGIAGGLLIK